jgi:AcrR family transcriptional regulator
VAEASGVAVSTLQYYFGSLEALLIETCLLANQRDLKLTSADEDTISALAETKSLRALAADYGVSHETVRTVLRARVVR